MNNAVEIQQLEQQYQNTLIQYKQALLDYRNATQNLQTGYRYSKDSLYRGEGLGEKLVSGQHPIKECEALCSANSKCVGGVLLEKIGENKDNFLSLIHISEPTRPY